MPYKVLSLRAMSSLRYYLTLFSVITFLVVIFQSCNDQELSKELDPPKSPLKTVEANFPQEEIFLGFISEIDSSKELTSGPTLHYLSNDESHTSALVFFDSEKSIKKVIVQDVRKDGSSELCSYYFRGGGVFYWVSEETKITGDEFEFLITKSYLDSAEQVVYSSRKSHSEYDSLEFIPFTAIGKTNKDKKRVIQLVNQEGPFETLFRGFSDFNGIKFMVVGTDDFTSTLEIDKNSRGDILKLIKNPNTYMSKKLNVSFTNYTKEDNIEYQRLLEVKIR